jgi:excinuclease ABC subunit C
LPEVSASLPTEPGVYWFLKNNQIVYVGKAKNLKKRLLSYAKPHRESPKTQALVNEATGTRYAPTEHELQALIIEAELINRHQPRYNIRLKDDKSALYIIFTKDDFPRVLTQRKTAINAQNVWLQFGPYQSSAKARQVLSMLRLAFPFCNLGSNKHQKACFYYHLKQCPGVCAGKISRQQYRRHLKQLSLILKGKLKSVQKELIQEIAQLSQVQQYEHAHAKKTQLETLNHLIETYRLTVKLPTLPKLTSNNPHEQLLALNQLLSTIYPLPLNQRLDRIECYDISTIQGQSATGAMVVASQGQLDRKEYRHFSIKLEGKLDDFAMLSEVVQRRLTHRQWPYPQLIILDGGKPQLRAVAKIVKWNIPMVGIAKDPDRLIVPSTPTYRYFRSILLDPHHPATKLLTQLRNEAHRFSRRLHHKHRDRELFQ